MGGDANHVKYLAEELVARGHEVHVLHSVDAYRVKRKLPMPCAKSDDVFTHQIKSQFSRTAYEAYLFGSSPRVNHTFRKLVREVSPDVTHHHNISLLGYEILYKQWKYLNLYTAHDYWVVCPQSCLLKNHRQICEHPSCTLCGVYFRRPPQLWRHGGNFPKALTDIDVLIAPSNYMRMRITREIPFRAITIPNFAPTPPARISSSGFSNFLMYAGGSESGKGVIQLLKWYKEMAQTNLKLVIVGAGMVQKIHELVRQYSLSDNVYPLGWADRDLLYALLKDSTALVVPSIWPENAPLVALEALSVGTPVIASNVGGLPEIVSELDARLIFSWERPDELGQAIRFVIDNKDRLRVEALRTYQKHYGVESYLSAYISVVSKGPGNSGLDTSAP